MTTFPSIKPTYGVQKNSAPKTRVITFADGYEHRLLFGLPEHQNPKIFNLTFEVSETDADIIENFLDDRAKDSASFDFIPPGEATSSKFVCEAWNKSIPYVNRARIQVTFRQVFEP